MRKWEELPKFMRTDEVKKFYDVLIRHEKELKLKRYFDILLSMILLVILSHPNIVFIKCMNIKTCIILKLNYLSPPEW